MSALCRSFLAVAQKKQLKSQRAVNSILTLRGIGGVEDRYSRGIRVIASIRSVILLFRRGALARPISCDATGIAQSTLESRRPEQHSDVSGTIGKYAMKLPLGLVIERTNRHSV